jgi:hypothetical protein
MSGKMNWDRAKKLAGRHTVDCRPDLSDVATRWLAEHERKQAERKQKRIEGRQRHKSKRRKRAERKAKRKQWNALMAALDGPKTEEERRLDAIREQLGEDQ